MLLKFLVIAPADQFCSSLPASSDRGANASLKDTNTQSLAGPGGGCSGYQMVAFICATLPRPGKATMGAAVSPFHCSYRVAFHTG